MMISVVSLILSGTSLLAEKPGPIIFRLLVPSANVCAAQPSLELEAVLTNEGKDELVINVDSLDVHVDLTKYENGTASKSQHMIKEAGAHSWRHVGPHQSIIVPFSESLRSDELLMHRFDEIPGLYEIQTLHAEYVRRADGKIDFLGRILSNKVFFLLSSCTKESGNAATGTEAPPHSEEPSTSTLLHESGRRDEWTARRGCTATASSSPSNSSYAVSRQAPKWYSSNTTRPGEQEEVQCVALGLGWQQLRAR
jgi:hypothetical protein